MNDHTEQPKDTGEDEASRIGKSLEKVLNLHGFSFQYAIVKRAAELSAKRENLWRLEGTEIPVGHGGDQTHIDIVFEPVGMYQQNTVNVYAICEAKRVDPARGTWCFAKSPYTWRNPNRTKNATQFDKISDYEKSQAFTASTEINYTSRETYELGFEVKTAEKGDGVGTHSRSAIDLAVTQVLRGVKGYIEYLIDSKDDTERRRLSVQNIFVPVIFTTANLYTTESNIALADLRDGKLPKDSVTVTKQPWIWFNYNRSVSLSHSILDKHVANEGYDRYFRDFSRTIAVISPDGIDEFLSSSIRQWSM